VQQKPKSTQQQQQPQQQHKTHQRTLYEEDSELGKITQQNQISTHNIQHIGCREMHTNNSKIHKPNPYTETCHPIHDLLSFWSYIHTLNFQKCTETHHQIMIFCS
jgi:hypothetical protein